MKTTKEMIDVMQSYERGEQIEAVYNDVWVDIDMPEWSWGLRDYRVKPKKKYVPFDTADEFLAAQRKHGITLIYNDEIRYNSSVNCHCIVTLTNKCTCSGNKVTFGYIYDSLHFEDGTPCGKEIEL